MAITATELLEYKVGIVGLLNIAVVLYFM